MLIPKNTKKEKVTNPMRPSIGVPREHSVARLSWGTYHTDHNESEPRIMVDADHNEEFVKTLEETIPEHDRHRCEDREVWLVDPQWKKFLADAVREHFDEAKIELRKW